MVGILIDEKQEDFIARLLRLIREGRESDAINEIMKLPDAVQKLDILEQLAVHIPNSVISQLQVKLAVALAVAHAREIAISRLHVPGLARELSLARALELTLARSPNVVRARDLANDLAYNLGQANALNRNNAQTLELTVELANALNLISNDNPELESIRLSVDILIFRLSGVRIPRSTQNSIEDHYDREITNTLEEGFYTQQRNRSRILYVIVATLQEMIRDDLRYITLEGIDAITPDALAYEIAPYIQALRDVKQVAFEISKRKSRNRIYEEPRIIQIHNDAPKVEIVGIGDIFRAISEVFAFRKRRAEVKQLEIKNDLLQQQIRLRDERAQQKSQAHNQQMIIQADSVTSEEEKAIRISILQEEFRQKQLESIQKALEVENQLWELEQKQTPVYVDAAVEALKKVAGRELTAEELSEHLPKMTQAMTTIIDSRLRMRIGWHDNPRPPTLPEERKI